ncbi:sensor histidine kinase [Actinoplanes couchii]|uniref:histidine kinase n=1 Tax=Actinoplanes couchii TaxID=403638 RepID=A0ABQ3X8J5_9ACTN|nr:HAMP domain-containing sensor histidine kinase [Actinoplanes couchii]MDR6320169.1 signal transduction histidine kinase [Actinoplanes couchii]GID54817.1 two-component sensor histidine kinase [Actinoplanes couchii]
MTVTTRLTVQFTALITLLLVIVLGAILVLFKIGADATTERDLRAASRLTSAQIAPGGIFVTVFRGDTVTTAAGQPSGLVDQETARRVLGGAGPVTRERVVGGRDYTTRTIRRDGVVVQVTAEDHRDEATLRRLASVLLLVGVAALGLAAVTAHVMARRAIVPMAEALAVQRRFVADASHELRSPLTLLSTRTQLLSRRRADVPADVAAGIDEMTRDTRALTRILDDLLIAADPRGTPPDGVVDLVAVAGPVVASMTSDDVAIVLSATADRVVVPGSAPAIERLLTALIANAVDYATTTVTVRIEAGRTATVHVIDDGPGFAPAMVRHAFEPFVTDRGAEDPGGHSGLGLAIAAEITHRHRGRIHIEAAAHGHVTLHLPG